MRKLIALLAFSTVVLACDTRLGGSSTSPFSSELGTYALRTVNGAPLPVQLTRQSSGTTRELIADTITLSAGGNAKEVFYTRSFTATSDTSISSVAFAGKYTITRDSVRLPAEFPYIYGRYSASTLTMVDGVGDVWVFTR